MTSPAGTRRHLRCLLPRAAFVLLVIAGRPPAHAASIVATVTDESGRALAQAVVTVTPLDGTPVPPGAGAQLATAIIDQKDETFVPGVVVIHTGGAVIFRNSDTTRHHVYSFAPIKQFEFVQKPGDVSAPVRFDVAGTAAIGCNIHDDMIAYVDVTDAPWAGVTGTTGQVELTGLPAGRFTATVWHPRLRPGAAPPSQTVTLATDNTTLAVSLPVLPPPRPHGHDSLYLVRGTGTMRFSTKLALFLIIVLVIVQAVTGAATYALIRGTLIEEGVAQLTTAATQFTRQLDEIARQMAAGVKILTLDYALRQAIAEHDHNTVVSALRNHGRRVGAARMLLVQTDGTIGADTQPSPGSGPTRFAYPALLEQAMENDRVASVAVLDGKAMWLVVVPVLAPNPIAFVAAALPLDDALLTRLRILAGLPRTTGLAIAMPDGTWRIVAGPIDAGLAGMLPVPGTKTAAAPAMIATPAGEAIFLATVLPTPADSPAVVAAMAYPLSDALRPYRQIVVVVLLGLAIGLLAAILGAWLVARHVVRPLELLAAYTRRIAAGDYAPPPALHRGDEVGELSAALAGMTRAIAEREEHIRHQATHDPVTGMANRQTLTETIDASATRGTAAIVVVALMRLQEIANTAGRELAERVMHDAALRLTGLLPGTTLGCIGERSFAALLPGCGAAGAQAVSAQVIAAFDRPYQEGDLTIDTAAAIGIALAPEHGNAAASLLRRAEVAQQAATQSESRAMLYRAESDPHRPELLSLMSDLRHGLQHDEFQLYFQPKLDLASNRITSAEAVVRWRHPLRGMIAPDSFIGLAEETGNIRHVTNWALRAGMMQAALWQKNGLMLRISLNLSVRDLADAELPRRIAMILDETGLPADALVLEITESAIMNEPDAAIAVLRRLADLNIALAIDDFGVGQSSLAYLRRMPVRELKIDKAFVLKLSQSPDDQTIVRSVVELGHSLGYRVTAEGVEDTASLEILSGFHCDQAQGYAIARPLAADAFERFVAGWHARRDLAGAAP